MESGGELKVGLSSDGEGRQFIITVSDTGCGISAENLSQVFDPYFTTKSSGTGLGLAIAHNAIEAMGGRISVASTKDSGTTFTVTLPNSEESRGDE
jgi:two-component system sensor histidine kinase HydH